MEAAVPPMAAPLCLVHNEDCKLSLNPAALAVLHGVTQPVVVVAMVGPLGSGKSFLMKRLAQKCTGSPLGSAAQTQTKGIWMWCLPHPCKPGVALVLLDTEGLGEANKGDSHSDIWIFTLALLLSSTFVFNCKQSTNDSMLQKLWLLMDLTHHVRVRVKANKAEPADEFARIFPGFVWVVRDFRLQEGQQPISGDEYLRQILHSGLGIFKKKHRNLRDYLYSFFPHRKLFMLEQPAADRDLARLEALREDQLQPQFRQHEEDFCQHIWKEAPVKVLLNRSQVTGRVLACLVETYVTAITSGSVLCVESALMVVADTENSRAVEEAVAEYQRGMEQGLVLPMASHATLVAMHQDWKQRAGTFFLSHAFTDTRRCYQALLMDKLEAVKEEFCRRNEEASEQRCRAVLQELWRGGEIHMQCGHYAVPGGMRLFQEELKRVVEEFKQMPDKGVKAEAVLEKFLRVKRMEMMEMWLDRVDQQCKAVLAEATATAQVMEERLEERLEEHRQQQRAELMKLRELKEAVELRICILEKQQEVMLAEVPAAKMAVEEQQQQQAALDMVTAAQEAAEAQLEEQRRQQRVVLAEVTAVKEAMEKQLEEQRRQQRVVLAEVTAVKEAMEKQLEEQRQQQQVVLAEVTAVKEAMEKQLEEQRQQQQRVALAEVTATPYVTVAQLEERWQQWAQQLREEQNQVLSQHREELEAQLQEGRGLEAAALQWVEPSWRSRLLKFLGVVIPILRILDSMVKNAT